VLKNPKMWTHDKNCCVIFGKPSFFSLFPSSIKCYFWTWQNPRIIKKKYYKIGGFCLLFCFVFVWDRVSLYNTGWPQTQELPASTFQTVGL
jgi:hypothetical protein